MSAGSLGARLLSQVHEEGLDSLLTDARRILEPRPENVLGQPQLDQILAAYRFPPDDSTPQPWAWESPTQNVHHSENVSDDEGTSPLSRNRDHAQVEAAIVELTSSGSASGKTNLLYYLAGLAILPTQSGGKNSVAVWLDTDGRFSASRLIQILQHHLATVDSTLTPLDRSTLARSVLHQVHVFQPQSSAQLIATLRDIPNYLLHQHTPTSGTRKLGLLILDSATAFYWQDRFDADIFRLEAAGTSKSTINDSVSKTAETITLLKSIQDQFHCAILFTTSTTTTSSFTTHTHQAPPTNLNAPSAANSTTTSPQYDVRLGTQWTNSFAALTLTLSRTPTLPFHPAMTMTECVRDQPNRLQAVSRARFVASVAVSRGRGRRVNTGSESRSGSGTGFAFTVTAEGVTIE